MTVPGISGATAARLERLIASPSSAARGIIAAIERDAYRATVGKDARFMDLFARAAPRQAARLVRSRMRQLMERGD